MASKTFRCITLLVIALTWCTAVTAAPARAASIAFDSGTVRLHHFKFYLDPALLIDMEFAKAVLPKYVSDMNAILAKNTGRQLVFDPQNDIIVAPTKPETDTAPSPLPINDFDIWAYAVPSSLSISYGGFASVDVSGAGVLANLHWTRIYDPDNLQAGDVPDYSTQLNVMLHEMAHVFGAGIGEYYSLSRIADSTQADPLLNIDSTDPADSYWSDKQDFMYDPLLQLTHAATRSDYVAQVRYSSLSAAMISGDYRNGVPSFNQYTIQVLDQDSRRVSGAEVRVWNIGTKSSYPSQLLFDQLTDDSGQVVLPWGGTGSSHTGTNMLRLIKVYEDGVSISQPRFISIFDADIAQLVAQQGSFLVVMRPVNQSPADITLSHASLDENEPIGALVGELAGVDPDAADTQTYAFCGGPDDGSFQLEGNDLVSAAMFDYEIKSSYSICVQVNDGRGGTLTKSFDIQINNLVDTSSVTFTSTAANDGWVLESATGSNKGGTLNAAATNILLGNDATNRRYRSVLAFNTGSLPDDAVLTRVTLKLRRRATIGADPFGTLGRLLLDVARPYIGSSGALQTADFQGRVDLASAGIFASRPDSDGWYSAQLKASAVSLVNLNGATQFRLRFSGNAGTGAAYLALYSGNAAAANRPVLVVEYELP